MKMMGIIFSNIYDEFLGDLTKNRSIASVPFGGRYRLIDFVLSNMVSSQITNIGIITKSNYQSLMDHLGNGKEWDLDRKRDGLFILPPFAAGQQNVYKGKLEALHGAVKYIEHSTEKYVVLSDSNVVCSIDYTKVLQKHIETGADITMVNRYIRDDEQKNSVKVVVNTDENQKVNDVMVNYIPRTNQLASMGIFILSRELLLRLVYEANAYNLFDFSKDVLQKKYQELNIYSYNYEGVSLFINSIQAYMHGNMSLLDREIRNEIFFKDGLVYTKSKDECPTLYDENCTVKNSLIADGCIINGTVENSIIFRGVKIKKGAVVKNSIIMQNSSIGETADLNYVITDKDVIITDNCHLIGGKEFPVVVSKGKVV